MVSIEINVGFFGDSSVRMKKMCPLKSIYIKREPITQTPNILSDSKK